MVFERTFVLLLLAFSVYSSAQSEVTNETALAFKQLLRVNSLPTPSQRHYDAIDSPPRYMLQLYEKYRRGDVTVNRGNTVRSILPLAGVSDMLLFNLSGVNAENEKILRSELHLSRRRKVKWFDKSIDSPAYRLLIYCNAGDDELQLLATINMTSSNRHGHWQLIDFTIYISECQQRHVEAADESLIAVKAQGLNRKSRYMDIAINSLVRTERSPFLIVFSHDQLSPKSIEELDTQFHQYKFLDDYADDYYDSNYSEIEEPQISVVLSPLKRIARSLKDNKFMSWVENNEFPENSVVYEKNSGVSKGGPEMLSSRKSKKKQSDKKVLPDGQVSAPFGQKRRKPKKKLTLPVSWQKKNHWKSKVAANDVAVNGHTGCERKNLTLSFADIGWPDIIAPEKFEAFYCAGTCQFPISMDTKPSNHALIQSLVKASGLRPEVPSPNCAASSMSSLSLLYLDENGGVVLRNYPEMVIESCSCR